MHLPILVFTGTIAMHSHRLIYNNIGQQYTSGRTPDPRIAEQIRAALGNAETVCNLGAGAGSYEPDDLEVTAVEPSQVMIAQRQSRHPVVCCSAESLPFDDAQFDAAMAVLTVHHWEDAEQGLREMRRVSRRQVVLTFDPNHLEDLWLVRDYLPEVVEFERQRVLSIETIATHLGATTIQPVEIPWDCVDGFQAAYWRRPWKYLDADVQANISSMAQLPEHVVQRGLARLTDDLNTGAWTHRYADLLDRDALDCGYRLIIAP